MAADVNMRVNVAGFGGNPVSLFAVFAPDTGDLVCTECLDMQMGEVQGFLHVSTPGAEVACDMRFTENDLSQAIQDFFMMDGMKSVFLDGKIQRLQPTNKIQADGVDINGVKYKLDGTVQNSHVAVLAACFAAQRQRRVATSIEAMDDLRELSELQSYTVGIDSWGL